MKTYDFKKFNVSSIQDHSSICMIAKRNSGKSWLVRDIIYNKRDIPAFVVIAPTDKLSGFYNEFIPSTFIHYEYDTHVLTKIFKRQELMIQKNKERKKEGKSLIDTRLMLIMDDCLASKQIWAKDQNISELLQNGRHYHITYILTMQYSLGVSPELRSNFDFIFLLGEDFVSNQKRLYDHYAGMFDSFDIFKKVFIAVTDNYACMVLNSQVKSKEITEKVFWYKAKVHEKFHVGGSRYIEFHKTNYNNNWKNKNKGITINDKFKFNLEK